MLAQQKVLERSGVRELRDPDDEGGSAREDCFTPAVMILAKTILLLITSNIFMTIDKSRPMNMGEKFEPFFGSAGYCS